MRSQLFFQGLIIFLAIGGVNSFGWIGIVLGAVEGVVSGVLNGTIGAFGPLAKDGLKSMMDFFGGMKGSIPGMDAVGGLLNQGMGAAGSLPGAVGGMASQGAGAVAGAVNQGMGAMSGMSSMFGGLGGIIQQIISSWGTIFTQIMNGGGDIFGTLFGIVKSMIENFFSIFGSLTGASRLQINHMIAGTGNVFASTMRMKLEPEKNVVSLKKELLSVQKIMEAKHASKDALVHAMKTKAPNLSAATQVAYHHASNEFDKHMKALNPEAKKGIKQMHAVMQKASFDIMGMLGSIPSAISTMMSVAGSLGSALQTGYNLFSNLFSVVKMIFPI